VSRIPYHPTRPRGLTRLGSPLTTGKGLPRLTPLARTLPLLSHPTRGNICRGWLLTHPCVCVWAPQAKEYEQDMRRMKKKLKKRAERQRAWSERPPSSLTPSEYGDEENTLSSHLGATLKALPAAKPAQPPGYAGRHRDHRYD